MYIDFMGTDAAIFRTLGKQTAMRTDQYNSRWLNGEHHPQALSGKCGCAVQGNLQTHAGGSVLSLGQGWFPIGDSIGEKET